MLGPPGSQGCPTHGRCSLTEPATTLSCLIFFPETGRAGGLSPTSLAESSFRREDKPGSAHNCMLKPWLGAAVSVNSYSAAWGSLNTHSLAGEAAMETGHRQDPRYTAEKSSSLPGPGRACAQEGRPATWAHFQEGVEASSETEDPRVGEGKLSFAGREELA